VDGSLTVTVVSSATGGRGGSYSYQVLGGSGSATIDTVSGYLMAINAGTVTIGVSSSGDGDYYGGNTTQEITIGKNTPTLSITSSDTMYVDGTLTATVTTTATGGRGGVITFSVRAGSGSATVDVNTGYVRAVGAGTVILTALSAGDSDYIANTQDQQITIGKTTPSLSITSGNSVGVDGTLTVTTTTSATLGRGGNMTYSIIGGSGSATVDGSTGLIQGISVGSVTLIATSAGDADYYSSNTSQLITINKVTPTLIITSVSNTIVDADLTATVVTTATGERGGNMTYSIIAGSGSATVNATTGLIHAVNAGTITLMVTSAGDTDYYSASTSQLINIGKATPTLVITSANSMIVDGVLTATISSSVASPGTITYSVTNGTGIIVVVSNTGKVTAIQAGGSTLKATSAGTSNYYPVTVSHVMTINKATPTLTITSPTGSTMIVNRSLTVTFTTSATLNRGGAKSYAITAGSGSATINPTTGFMTAVSVGTVTLTVSTAGDASYYLASASKLITITASMLAVDPVVTNPVLPKEKPAPISTLGQEEHNDSEDQTVGVSMVISPNGDGLNDVLVINRIEDHPDNEVVIANRSGEMVFKTHGYNNGTVVFAGASNTGAPLANGVYYYTLLFYDQGKLNRRVGYFELRR
jgi:gliding motility-associated-like protein